MVTTFQTKPAPVLQPYISCYALRTFDTGKFILPRPMHGVPEYYITFFLKERYCIMEYTDGSRGRFSNSITGFLSQNNGCTYYQGSYHILCVQIKANGLFTIFGIPQRLIQNTVLDLEDLLGNDSNRLTEQCEECNTIDEMAKILDSFFIKKLLARKVRTDTATINVLANELFMKKGLGIVTE